MKRSLFGVAILAAATLSSPADSRLLGEVVRGGQRLCAYDGGGGHSNPSRTRVLHLDISRRCPTSYPGEEGAGAPPSSAMLQSEAVDGERRVCTYEQLGATWRRTVSLQISCPSAAGMLPPDSPLPTGGR